MLVFPEHSSPIININSIDPGTTNLGFATISVNVAMMKIIATNAITFNSDRMLDDYEILSETYGERMSKITHQRLNLVRRFRNDNPTDICCESPFYNRLRPGAYGPLMEILNNIQLAAIEYNPYIKFTLYSPSIIKKSLGGGAIANKGKEPIREHLLKIKDTLNYIGVIPFEELDEHSLDAIAIGLCHFNIMKENYLSCLS